MSRDTHSRICKYNLILKWKHFLDATLKSLLFVTDYKDLPCRVAGPVLSRVDDGGLDLTQHFKKTQRDEYSLATCYSIVAADEALQQAKWTPETEEDKCKTGTMTHLRGLYFCGIVTSACAGWPNWCMLCYKVLYHISQKWSLI